MGKDTVPDAQELVVVSDGVSSLPKRLAILLGTLQPTASLVKGGFFAGLAFTAVCEYNISG